MNLYSRRTCSHLPLKYLLTLKILNSLNHPSSVRSCEEQEKTQTSWFYLHTQRWTCQFEHYQSNWHLQRTFECLQFLRFILHNLGFFGKFRFGITFHTLLQSGRFFTIGFQFQSQIATQSCHNEEIKITKLDFMRFRLFACWSNKIDIGTWGINAHQYFGKVVNEGKRSAAQWLSWLSLLALFFGNSHYSGEFSHSSWLFHTWSAQRFETS